MRTKNLWLVYVVMLLAGSANAQNTFPASGNVGIGTATPADALSVNGDADIGARFKFDNPNAYGGTSAVFGLNGPSAGTRFLFYDYVSGVPLMTVNDAASGGGVLIGPGFISSSGVVNAAPTNGLAVQGNIGIGTANPLSALTLAGSNATNPNTGAQIDYAGENITFENTVVGKAIGDIKMVQPTGYYVDAGDMVFSTSLGALSEKMRVTAVGNVGIGTISPGAKLDVAGSVKLSGNGSSITFFDGTIQSTAWNGTLCGGDYAESVDVSGDRSRYEPGDVLVIDVNEPGKFLKSNEPYSTAITGIYSTKPGLIGRRQASGPEEAKVEVPMAMVGIVPTKVSAENGPIKPGDFLVTSSILGYAMKGTDRNRMFGAVVGKALGSLLSGTGVIEVVVSLQ